jgi:hypothetical protein
MVLWRAKEATVLIGSTLSSVGTTTTLAAQMSSASDWSGVIKSIEIAGAEADVDSVYLFGASAGGQQNAEVEENNTTMREFTGTLIYNDADAAELATGTATAIGTTGYSRIQGDGTRSRKAVLVSFSDGTNHANVLLNNVYFTKLGDISLDAEGHAEQEVTGKCLAKDYYEEDDFSA